MEGAALRVNNGGCMIKSEELGVKDYEYRMKGDLFWDTIWMGIYILLLLYGYLILCINCPPL